MNLHILNIRNIRMDKNLFLNFTIELKPFCIVLKMMLEPLTQTHTLRIHHQLGVWVELHIVRDVNGLI